MLLLDSLRQGFPIGSFLFLQSNPSIDLAPREFRGSAKEAGKGTAEELVLDGQQRITAGLELFFDRGANHYFIDIAKLAKLAASRNVNLDERSQIRIFLADLDAEDGYCKRLKASANPAGKLLEKRLLWTGLLLDDDELERAILDYAKAYPDEEKTIRIPCWTKFSPEL